MLEEAVAQNNSIAGVMRHFGLRANGGNSTHMRNRLNKYGIDTSHFTGAAWNKGGVARNRKEISEILVVLPEGSNRPKRAQLKRAMLESGLPYQCECGNLGEWQGKTLCLEIDHINGDWYDNRLENLRFRCPNCHSQDPTSNTQKRKK